MSHDERTALLQQIEANVRAIEERRQQNLETFVQAARTFAHDMLETIEQFKAGARS